MGCLCLFRFFWYYPHPYQKLKDDYLAFQPIAPRINTSLALGDTAAIVTEFRTIPYEAYLNYKLKERPDVYFLCIESYGQILTANKELASQFHPMVHRFDSSLQAKGWYGASSYSLSPVAGGSSWIAFTSALSGIALDNHMDFKELISVDFNVPHMTNFFNHFEYETFRLKTFASTQASTEEAYKIQNDYFKFDHWLKFKDFNYKGYVYNFFGGIPDQYALEYFHENHVAPLNKPQFTFFITMNTHGPWFLPPPITDHWSELNEIKSNPDPRAPADARIGIKYEDLLPGRFEDRYLDAMEYELKILQKFIFEKINENSVVILLGDHQPGHITEYDFYGLESVLHIISKNEDFIKAFREIGFKDDMRLYPGQDHSIKHEGLFSTFAPIFLEFYGDNPPSRRPKIYPDGV